MTPIEQFIYINHEYYTPSDVAKELDVTRDAVLRAYKRLGIKPRSPFEILLQNIKDHPQDDIQELSIRYDYQFRYIQDIVRKYDLPNKSSARIGRPTVY